MLSYDVEVGCNLHIVKNNSINSHMRLTIKNILKNCHFQSEVHTIEKPLNNHFNRQLHFLSTAANKTLANNMNNVNNMNV